MVDGIGNKRLVLLFESLTEECRRDGPDPIPVGGEKRSAPLSNLRRLHRHIHRRPGSTEEANMTSQLTTTQALKSFAGAAIFGLGMDLASLLSCRLSDAIWFALRGRPGAFLGGAVRLAGH